MAAFNVSVLADFGYDETNYVDPMETTWRAKKEATGVHDWGNVKTRLEWMGQFEPYDHADEVDGWLDDYYKTYTPKASTSTSSVVTSSSAVASSSAALPQVLAATLSTSTTSPAVTSKATTTSTSKTSTSKTSTTSTKKKEKDKRNLMRFVPAHPRDIPRRTAMPEPTST
jgi:bilirubin oxidase